MSHHLEVLTEAAGFLSRSRRGTWAYYQLQSGALTRVAGLLTLTAGRPIAVTAFAQTQQRVGTA